VLNLTKPLVGIRAKTPSWPYWLSIFMSPAGNPRARLFEVLDMDSGFCLHAPSIYRLVYDLNTSHWHHSGCILDLLERDKHLTVSHPPPSRRHSIGHNET
jgi:hypothetical protein